MPTDASNPDSVKALFDKIESAYGRIDVIFNNAGMGAPTIPMDEITFEYQGNPAGISVEITPADFCEEVLEVVAPKTMY